MLLDSSKPVSGTFAWVEAALCGGLTCIGWLLSFDLTAYASFLACRPLCHLSQLLRTLTSSRAGKKSMCVAEQSETKPLSSFSSSSSTLPSSTSSSSSFSYLLWTTAAVNLTSNSDCKNTFGSAVMINGWAELVGRKILKCWHEMKNVMKCQH